MQNSSKIHPKPTVHAAVWAQQHNMHDEEVQDDVSTPSESNILCSESTELLLHSSSMDDIFEVIKNGERQDVENLVEKLGPEALSARDKHGYTLAHWLALDGSVDMMRYLVERNINVDLPCLGTQGPRPIHWACRKGHASVVQVLLQQAGVAVNAADFKGLTPLMTACMYGKTGKLLIFVSLPALNEFGLFLQPLLRFSSECLPKTI